ncbi:Beta-lactamase domain-containing protein 2 [Diplodia seriata]|uniref:Beta-lactamase domain-containing protein 2 n=1 Tax=Diplodia seriata TaxID=420778 RepID=A0A1S8BA19_9PEZI|nr:Beta-lactamase domain-containing protein 2 [Diplodia seriata]
MAPAPKVHGHCAPHLQPVADLLQQHLATGGELGASLVVNVRGRDILDLYGGHADAARTRPWESSTIAPVWSTTKCVAALAALVLVSRGLLDPRERVAAYWPAFAANGKEKVEVRHVLAHASGVSGWDAPVTLDDVLDVPAATALLAAQRPWWEPGTAAAYHSFTLGHLLGELVRRVTGKTLKAFVADELAGPLAADFQMGAREDDWGRVADVVPPAEWARPPQAAGEGASVAAKTMRNPTFDIAVANTPTWRRAELGAASGFGNARGVARIMSAVSLGGAVDGHELLSRETVELIFEEQVRGVDLATGQHLRRGLGFALTGRDTSTNWIPEGKICFWGGLGGSIVIMDVERQMTISYVMNKMEMVGLGNDRTKEYVRAIYACMGVDF